MGGSNNSFTYIALIVLIGVITLVFAYAYKKEAFRLMIIVPIVGVILIGILYMAINGISLAELIG